MFARAARSEQPELSPPTPRKKENQLSPLKHSNNIAARMGRWSASHWKTAVFGWLAFVVAAFVIGNAVGTKYLETATPTSARPGRPTRSSTPASRRRRREGEIVLIQSKTLNARDPAFEAAIDGRRRRRSTRSRRSRSSTRRSRPVTPT